MLSWVGHRESVSHSEERLAVCNSPTRLQTMDVLIATELHLVITANLAGS